jgi:general secretion pathway protein G
VTGTRRADPTVVFLPDEHEAIQRKRARNKRIAAAAISISLVAGLVLVVTLLVSHETSESRQAAARDSMARRELALLADALERFRTDVGRYPTDNEGIASLRKKPVPANSDEVAILSYWSGPYIDVAIELDPWGNDYVYRSSAEGGAFELHSAGPGGDEPNPHLRITSQN